MCCRCTDVLVSMNVCIHSLRCTQNLLLVMLRGPDSECKAARAEVRGAVLAGACSFSQMGGEVVYPVCRATLKGLALKNQMTLQKRGAKIRCVDLFIDDSWTPMHVSPPPHTPHIPHTYYQVDYRS